ncbi:hypothetical protein [Streptomyces sp. NPDC003327]
MIPDNDWMWSVLEFGGIVQGNSGMEYSDIRQRVDSSPHGYVMSWEQVRKFAAGVRQCFDLLLVAVSDRPKLNPELFAAGDFAECFMMLSASDGTWWTVEIRAETDQGAALAAGLRASHGVELS